MRPGKLASHTSFSSSGILLVSHTLRALWRCPGIGLATPLGVQRHVLWRVAKRPGLLAPAKTQAECLGVTEATPVACVAAASRGVPGLVRPTDQRGHVVHPAYSWPSGTSYNKCTRYEAMYAGLGNVPAGIGACAAVRFMVQMFYLSAHKQNRLCAESVGKAACEQD